MTDPTRTLEDVGRWLRQSGLEGVGSEELFEGFCQQLRAAGMPLMRAQISTRAHHPEIGSLIYIWHHADGSQREAFAHANTPSDDWLKSPLFHLMTTDIRELRVTLGPSDPPSTFPFLENLRAEGATDYFSSKVSFGPRHGSLVVDPENPTEGMLISFASDGPDGFTKADLDALRELILTLGLALKSAANRLMADDLLAAYLGADAGRRVMSGDIRRGSFEELEAAILTFDLEGFTKLSEQLPGPDLIAMLNAYFGEMVAITERHGGNVLKFMGDGMLAIFPSAEDKDARLHALEAVTEMREQMLVINAARLAQGLTVTDFSAALHAGAVNYGNIGGANRLDFTVIGPAVNTTARILGMAALVDQRIVISSAVARPLLAQRPDLVSLGQYRLRGVTDRQELFTID